MIELNYKPTSPPYDAKHRENLNSLINTFFDDCKITAAIPAGANICINPRELDIAVRSAIETTQIKRIITTEAESRSVQAILSYIEATGVEIVRVAVDISGRPNLDEIALHAEKVPAAVMLSLAVEQTGAIRDLSSNALLTTPLIVDAEFAAATAMRLKFDIAAAVAIGKLRDEFERAVTSSISDSLILAAGTDRLPDISNICFANTNGEMIAHRLYERGISVATCSACADDDSNAVLRSMGIPFAYSMGSIRSTVPSDITAAQVKTAAASFRAVVGELRQR